MSWELCWSRQAQLNLKSFCFLISYIFPAVNLGWLFICIHCLISKILWRESPAPVFREVKLGFCNNTMFIWLFVCFSCLCGTEQSTPTIKRCWSKFRSWRWRQESWEKPCFVTVMERGRAILCWCFKKNYSSTLPVSHLSFKSDCSQGKKASVLYNSVFAVLFHICLLPPPKPALPVSFLLRYCWGPAFGNCSSVSRLVTRSAITCPLG